MWAKNLFKAANTKSFFLLKMLKMLENLNFNFNNAELISSKKSVFLNLFFQHFY